MTILLNYSIVEYIMNKPVIWLSIGAAVLVILGLVFFINTNNNQGNEIMETATPTVNVREDNEQIVVETNKDETMKEQSRYRDYSTQAFADANDQKRVIFFHAAWCPTCRPADAEFQSRADEIPEGVVVFKADYDTEDELKEQYDITYQHTYVQVDAQGNEITKWNGGSVDGLIENLQ